MGMGALLFSGPVGNMDAKSQRVVPGPSLSHRRHWPVPAGSHITSVSGGSGSAMSQGVPAGGSRMVGAGPCLQAMGSSLTTLGRGCRLHTQHSSPLLHQLDLGINEFYRKTFSSVPTGPPRLPSVNSAKDFSHVTQGGPICQERSGT